MRRPLRAGTHMENRKDFRERVDGQPEHLCMVAEACAQLVQLEVREPEMAEGALVQGQRVLTSSGQPGGNSRLPKAEDPLCGGWVQPFGQREIRTMATLEEGVFRRYKGVLRRALKVVWHAWQRKVWIGSARPCFPSPTCA